MTDKTVTISQDDKLLKTYDYSADTVGAWAEDDDASDDELIQAEMCKQDGCICEH